MPKRMALVMIGFSVALTCRAGTPQKWDDLPRAVRDTVLANGGKSGMTVDKEPGMIDGKAVYEAGIKGKDGNIIDLVITEDGKLVKIKTDDAADKAAERAHGRNGYCKVLCLAIRARSRIPFSRSRP